MKKIIRLTESDLARLVKRVINEQKKPIPDCLKHFMYNEFQSPYSSGQTIYLVNDDGITIRWNSDKNEWNDTYEEYVSNKKRTGKWKCENGKFVMIT